MRTESECVGNNEINLSSAWNWFRKVDIFSLFISVVIVLTPFYYRTGRYIPLEYCREGLLLFSAIFGSILFAQGRSFRFTTPILILLCMGYCNQYHYMATSMLLQYLPYAGALLLLHQLLHRKLNIEYIKFALRIIFVLESFWLVLNYFKIEPYQWIFPEIYFQTSLQDISKVVPIMGSLGNKTPSALLIAICFPFLLQGRWRYFLPLGMLSLYLAGSASSFMAFLLAIGIWFYVKYSSQDISMLKKRGILAFIGLSLFFYYLYTKGFFYASERFTKWPLVLQLNDSPLWGKGLGHFHDTFPAFSKGVEAWIHAHNIILDMYYAFGIAGLAVVAYLLKQANYKKDIEITCSFIGLLVGGMFYSAFHQVPLALIGIVLFSTMANKEAL